MKNWVKGIDFPEWMTSDGLSMLSKGYLLPDETPNEMYCRVANAAANRLNKPELAEKFYDYMMKNWLCLASPVASNMGTTRGLPISCFGLNVPDSIDGIFKSIHEFASMSKMGGGVGVGLTGVRGRNTPITGNGKSEGVVPWAKVVDSTVISVSQGSTRRGAGSVNLHVDHLDIEEFLKIRRPMGDVNRQCLNLHQCVVISDSFMQKVENGDQKARELFKEILKTRAETGEPYLMFEDTVNNNNPECYKQLGLKVSMTNICSEITLHTDDEHSFVCCLSSLNVARWEEWKDTDLVETAIWFLDGVMSEFIAKASSLPGFERSVRFAQKSRALGLGVLGWHSLLQQKNLPFDSFESMRLNNKIFKLMREKAEIASKALANEYGEPEWCKGTGRRNSHLLAVAPTVSNSTISGGVSAGIEPIAANAFAQKTAKGVFTIKNPTLEKLLESKGKNNDEVWKSIVVNEGSVQHLDFLSILEKEVFLTAREINQMAIIRQAGQRQKYIDQSQSVNLFFAVDVDPRWFYKVHMEAWKQGVKTLYYCRSSSILKADSASRNSINQAPPANQDDCKACEA